MNCSISVHTGSVHETGAEVVALSVDNRFNEKLTGSLLQRELTETRSKLMRRLQYPLGVHDHVVEHFETTAVRGAKGVIIYYVPHPLLDQILLDHITASLKEVLEQAKQLQYKSIALSVPYSSDSFSFDPDKLVRRMLAVLLSKLPNSGITSVFLMCGSARYAQAVSAVMAAGMRPELLEEHAGEEERTMDKQAAIREGRVFMKQCVQCKTCFATTSSANRHLRQRHGLDTSKGTDGYLNEVDSRDVTYQKLSKKPDNAEANEIHHWLDTRIPVSAEQKESFKASPVCRVCPESARKPFSTQATLNRHMRRTHGMHGYPAHLLHSSPQDDDSSSSANLLNSIASLVGMAVLPAGGEGEEETAAGYDHDDDEEHEEKMKMEESANDITMEQPFTSASSTDAPAAAAAADEAESSALFIKDEPASPLFAVPEEEQEDSKDELFTLKSVLEAAAAAAQAAAGDGASTSSAAAAAAPPAAVNAIDPLLIPKRGRPPSTLASLGLKYSSSLTPTPLLDPAQLQKALSRIETRELMTELLQPESAARCHLCKKNFSQTSTLNRHLRTIHKLDVKKRPFTVKQTACPDCGEIFRSESAAIIHRKEVHGGLFVQKRPGALCPVKECDWNGQTHREMVAHAAVAHSTLETPFKLEQRKFDNIAEFNTWLSFLNLSRGINWLLRSRKLVDGVRQEYRYCSLEPALREWKEKKTGRWDPSKQDPEGMKDGKHTHCPCYLKVLIHADNSIHAEYCLDHLGHAAPAAGAAGQQLHAAAVATTSAAELLSFEMSREEEAEDEQEDEEVEPEEKPEEEEEEPLFSMADKTIKEECVEEEEEAEKEEEQGELDEHESSGLAEDGTEQYKLLAKAVMATLREAKAEEQLDFETKSLTMPARFRCCHKCQKWFSCGSTLNRHMREIHNEVPARPVYSIPCPICGECFSSAALMGAHRRDEHGGLNKMACPVDGCDWNVGCNHRELVEHAAAAHATAASPFLWQRKIFSNRADFVEWLEKLRRDDGTLFYIRRSEKRGPIRTENRCCYYEENRHRSRLAAQADRQRAKFSRKTVGSCTCYLATKIIEATGVIEANFCLDHLGHETSADYMSKVLARTDGSMPGYGDDDDATADAEHDADGHEDEHREEEEPAPAMAEEAQSRDESPPPLDDHKKAKALPPLIDGQIAQTITRQDRLRLEQVLDKLSSDASHLQYSHQMDRLVTYLSSAFLATGLDKAVTAAAAATTKRKLEDTTNNGIKRERLDK